MILFGESLNVISTKIGGAFKARDPKPIQEEALDQKERGMDYIDINLGPAKKDGHELMPWVVQTVQEVVDDVPLAVAEDLDLDVPRSRDVALEEHAVVAEPGCGLPLGAGHCIGEVAGRLDDDLGLGPDGLEAQLGRLG